MKRSFVALFVLALAALMRPASAAEQCTSPGIDLNDLVPMHITAAQRAVLTRSYETPEVRGLRAALDAYLAGKADPRTVTLLSATPKTILRNHFILLDDEQNAMGGANLRVLSKSRYDAVYRTWVYQLSNGRWELRAWDVATCTPAESRWLRARYGAIFDTDAGA
ncbi:MAG TPA: hypothetical protein VMD91_10925 [Candidatus Sulfotelmatobacter sp.]|nr:hypothetical protein [Candidatus Sulfotelmatobacter sp.]